jgi:hypothetical protein
MLAEHTFRPLLHVCRNGQKVAVALEELGLPYEAHTIDIRKRECSSHTLKSPYGPMHREGASARPLAADSWQVHIKVCTSWRCIVAQHSVIIVPQCPTLTATG